MSGIFSSVTMLSASANMKAVIRSDKGVEYVALLSETYDDAVQECLELLKENEEVTAIID